MAKIKIHEIAKELGVASKEIVAKAQELGMEVTSHMSAVSEEQAEKIKSSLKNVESNATKQEKIKGKNKNDKITKNNETDKKKVEKQTPVIIRREVINTDFEEKEEKKEKQQNNRNDVGFVERRKNQDYNIVYRKQPVKPKTVSELFGLKTPQKEEKNEEPKVELEKEIEEKDEKITAKPETEVTNIQENSKQNQIKEETSIDNKLPNTTVKHDKQELNTNKQYKNNGNYENKQNNDNSTARNCKICKMHCRSNHETRCPQSSGHTHSGNSHVQIRHT